MQLQDIGQYPPGYADTMGRLRVTTNTADAFGLTALFGGVDWILCGGADSGAGEDNLATVWDGQYNETAKPVN